jgi:hypothetical protein
MSFHTAYSPSRTKQFRNCSGVVTYCNALPEHQRNVSGEAAQLGTATHGLVEHCLREGKEPESFRDRIIELIGDEEEVSILRPNAKVPGPNRVFFVVDSDMIDGATMMTDYVRKRCEELGVPLSKVQLETRTNPLPERDDTSGTADVTLDAFPEILEVVDYKNGWNVVEHKDNDQLNSYLLGKALETEFAHDEYQITVVQPNAPHEEGRIREFKTTKKKLLAYQKTLRADIARCDEADNEFHHLSTKAQRRDWEETYLKAGEHCLFCDAAPVCPARLALAQDDAKADFADEPHDLEEPINSEEAARILQWAPRMEALIRAAAMYVQRDMENGFAVPGLKLVHGRSVRTLKEMDEAKIVALILKGNFVANKALLYSKPKLKSGPQIVDMVAKDKRKTFESKFIVKPLGKLTVTTEDDPRPAVERSAADDFKDDEEFG